MENKDKVLEEKRFKFEFTGEDTRRLTYINKDEDTKVIDYKITIDNAVDLENINAIARIKLVKFLKEQGINKNDLIIETKGKNGEIIIDDSQYLEIEKEFIDKANQDAMQKLVKDYLGITFTEFVLDYVGTDKDIENQPKEKIDKLYENIKIFGYEFAKSLKERPKNIPFQR